jgi:hypothetical protein
MISTKRFTLVSVALAAVGFSSAAWITWELRDPGVRSSAAWAFEASDLGELTLSADAVVLARATETVPSRVAFSDLGDDALPYEATSFLVEQSIRGPAAGETIWVERAGGLDPVELVDVVIDADGGTFEVGSTYLLFLKEQEPGGYYYQINGQSRFVLHRDRLLSFAASEDDPVIESLHGQRLSSALEMLRFEVRRVRKQ